MRTRVTPSAGAIGKFEEYGWRWWPSFGGEFRPAFDIEGAAYSVFPAVTLHEREGKPVWCVCDDEYTTIEDALEYALEIATERLERMDNIVHVEGRWLLGTPPSEDIAITERERLHGLTILAALRVLLPPKQDRMMRACGWVRTSDVDYAYLPALRRSCIFSRVKHMPWRSKQWECGDMAFTTHTEAIAHSIERATESLDNYKTAQMEYSARGGEAMLRGDVQETEEMRRALAWVTACLQEDLAAIERVVYHLRREECKSE